MGHLIGTSHLSSTLPPYMCLLQCSPSQYRATFSYLFRRRPFETSCAHLILSHSASDPSTNYFHSAFKIILNLTSSHLPPQVLLQLSHFNWSRCCSPQSCQKDPFKMKERRNYSQLPFLMSLFTLLLAYWPLHCFLHVRHCSSPEPLPLLFPLSSDP